MLVGVRPVRTPSSEEVGIMFIASGFPDEEGMRSTKRDDSLVISTGVICVTKTPTNAIIYLILLYGCGLVCALCSLIYSLYGQCLY